MPNHLTDEQRENRFDFIEDVLLRLSVIDPNVICAGGAPRDLYFYRYPKDYDVFLNVSEYYPTPTLRRNIASLFGVDEGLVLRLGVEYAVAVQNGDFQEVFQFAYRGAIVEVIVLFNRHPQQTLNRFPCQLSLGYITVDSLMTANPIQGSRPLKQAEDSGICWVREDAPVNYVERMAAKFPEIEFLPTGEWLARKGIRPMAPEPIGGVDVG